MCTLAAATKLESNFLIIEKIRNFLQHSPSARYLYTLCRRAVVATFDLSAANLNKFAEDHWLKDPSNVVQLHLDGPAGRLAEWLAGRPRARAHVFMRARARVACENR